MLVKVCRVGKDPLVVLVVVVLVRGGAEDFC
jgi:hypothetical protein